MWWGGLVSLPSTATILTAVLFFYVTFSFPLKTKPQMRRRGTLDGGNFQVPRAGGGLPALAEDSVVAAVPADAAVSVRNRACFHSVDFVRKNKILRKHHGRHGSVNNVQCGTMGFNRM